MSFQTDARIAANSVDRVRAFLKTHCADPSLKSIELHQLVANGKPERVAATDANQDDLFLWIESEAAVATVMQPSAYFELVVRKAKRGRSARCRLELRALAKGDEMLRHQQLAHKEDREAWMGLHRTDQKFSLELATSNQKWGEIALARERTYVEHEIKRTGLLADAQDRKGATGTNAWDTAQSLVGLLSTVANRWGGEPAKRLSGLGGTAPDAVKALSSGEDKKGEAAIVVQEPDGDALDDRQNALAAKFRDSLTDEQKTKLRVVLDGKLLDVFIVTTDAVAAGRALLHILKTTEQHLLLATMALLDPEQQSTLFGMEKK